MSENPRSRKSANPERLLMVGGPLGLLAAAGLWVSEDVKIGDKYREHA